MVRDQLFGFRAEGKICKKDVTFLAKKKTCKR